MKIKYPMKNILISLAMLCMLTVLTEGRASAQDIGKASTAAQITAGIIAKTGAKPIPSTVDVIKEGDPETVVSGIVTTMFATMDVLKRAVDLKANLVIVHEPLYYNHTDATGQLAGDMVFLEKQKFIRDNKLVIWRFHDYIHSLRPDGIVAGMTEKLGWQQYLSASDPNQFVIPETTLEDVLSYLKKRFPGCTFNVVGDRNLKVKNVKLAVGAPGSSTHLRMLRQDDTDLLLAGESPQWETYEYMRDAVQQGRKKAVVFLGHIPSEEAGMDYCARWLKGFIGDIPVNFVPGGSSYWTY